ncbi:FG-GAP repeat domain-containing protein [Streptomyces zaomyceticus]|uniref:FG-GAP repeat domain-containing protein n=1 Tax=Streptomyces zaomyceticus TaxID=68286 RepID=UPI003432FC40
MRDTAGRLLLADTFRATDWGSGYEWFQEHHFKVVGQGYGIYDKIEATGDLGGSGADDFVARDRAGVLWLYKGRGGHSFSARIRIGGGWGGYGRPVGIGDADRDGRPDLYTQGFLYRGTGDYRSPLRPREETSPYHFWPTAVTYDHFA